MLEDEDAFGLDVIHGYLVLFVVIGIDFWGECFPDVIEGGLEYLDSLSEVSLDDNLSKPGGRMIPFEAMVISEFPFSKGIIRGSRSSAILSRKFHLGIWTFLPLANALSGWKVKMLDVFPVPLRITLFRLGFSASPLLNQL